MRWKRRTCDNSSGDAGQGGKTGIHTERPQARDAQCDDAGLLLYRDVSRSGAAGADLEEI